MKRSSSGKELHRIKVANRPAALALNPDGTALATIEDEGDTDARLVDLASGKTLRSFRDGKADAQPVLTLYSGVVFSPDGKALVTAFMELDNATTKSVALVWDVTTGKRRHRFESDRRRAAVTLPVFAPNGKWLAWSDASTVTLRDVTTGKVVRQLTDGEPVASLAFSPNGKTLYGKAALNGTVVAWDATSGKELRTLGPSGPMRSGRLWRPRGAGLQPLAVSPDGKLLACAGNGYTVHLLDARTGKEALPLDGHEAAVVALSYGRDGKSLTTQGADGTVRVWDRAKGIETAQVQIPGRSPGALLSPDGRTLAVGGASGDMRLVDAATGKIRHTLAVRGRTMRMPQLAFSRDGKTLAVRNRLELAARVFDVDSGKELRSLGQAGRPDTRSRFGRVSVLMVLSADGKVLALPNAEGTVVLWEVADGRELRRIALPKGRVPRTGAFTADGKALALDLGGGVSLWEVATVQERRLYGSRPKEPADEREDAMLRFQRLSWLRASGASTVALAADGRTLALGGAAAVRVWDVPTGRLRGQLAGQQGEVMTLAFGPGGRTLATGGADGTVLIWDVAVLPGAAPKKELAERELQRCWADLAGDAGKAFDAIYALALAPEKGSPFLGQRLRPAVAVDARQVERLIADLESRRFAVREKARRELERLGGRVAPALVKVLGGKPPLETRKRLQELLDRLAARTLSGAQLRVVRAIEVLEHSRTAAARNLLRVLAKGAPGALETEEARAARDRLGK